MAKKDRTVPLTLNEQQAVLDYVKQGRTLKFVATALDSYQNRIEPVYNRYLKDALEAIELDRADEELQKVLKLSITPRERRIEQMHEMLNKTIDDIYDKNLDEDGNFLSLDSGDFALILKLLERDEQHIMSAGRLYNVKKKNNDSRFMYNKEKQIKVDEMNKKYEDNKDDAVMLVQSIVDEIEDA